MPISATPANRSISVKPFIMFLMIFAFIFFRLVNGRASHSPWKILSDIDAIGLLCPFHVFKLILCGLLICDISVTPSQCVNIPCYA